MSSTTTISVAPSGAHSSGPASAIADTVVPDHHVTWAAGTIDNEGMGKKKSKKCCIFKKRYEFGESSSESEGECMHTECSRPTQA
jgi:protein phosphatase 1 regulatory subunit 11